MRDEALQQVVDALAADQDVAALSNRLEEVFEKPLGRLFVVLAQVYDGVRLAVDIAKSHGIDGYRGLWFEISGIRQERDHVFHGLGVLLGDPGPHRGLGFGLHVVAEPDAHLTGRGDGLPEFRRPDHEQSREDLLQGYTGLLIVYPSADAGKHAE